MEDFDRKQDQWQQRQGSGYNPYQEQKLCKLCNYFQVTYGELPETSYVFNFSDFCKTYKLHSTLVFNSLNALSKNGVINLTNTYSVLCEIQFTATNNTLFSALEKQPQHNALVKTLLRSYGGIQSQLTKVNMPYLTEKLNRSEDAIINESEKISPKIVEESPARQGPQAPGWGGLLSGKKIIFYQIIICSFQ